MHCVTITEFRKNLSHYIELSSKENIQITNNGKVVAVLSNPDKQYYQSLAELCGCLERYDAGENYDDLIGEGILSKAGRHSQDVPK